MMESDPFASFIEECQCDSSQEEILRNSSFVEQRKVFLDGDSSPELSCFSSAADETHVEPTGIIIVSPEHSSSLPSGSEDQKHLASAVDASEGMGNEAVLGSVNDGEAVASEDGSSATGLKSRRSVNKVNVNQIAESELEQSRPPVSELIEPLRTRASEDNLGTENPKVSKSRKIDELSKKVEGSFLNKNIDDIAKFEYVASGGIVQPGKGKGGVFIGKRQLPLSMRGGEKDCPGREGASSSTINRNVWKDLLTALNQDAGGKNFGSQEVDFVATAMRRGMTLPRPRWWPPEF